MMHLEFRETIKPTAALLAALCLASACSRTANDETARVEVLRPVETARSTTAVEFSRITDVDVDSRGRIYAGDRLGEIVVLDRDGTLVRRFGRPGGGPGEFQSVGTVHLLDGDSLYVYDGTAQRATVYAPDSDRVAYTIRLPQPDFSFPMDVEPTRDGQLIAHFRRINGDVPVSGLERNDVIRILGRDGSVHRDSVLIVREPDVLEVRTEQTYGFFLPAFGRQSLVRWDANGRLYSLWTDSAHVRIHDGAGRPRGSFTARLPVPRMPLAAATVDSTAQANAALGIPARTLAEAFRARWKTWPLVQDMLVDDRSRVWIMPLSHGPEADWLAFDTRGAQVAALRLPRAVHPRLIRGDRLYAVSKDSLDVETLVVYRLTPSSTPTSERP
jgi:hypothetical protein